MSLYLSVDITSISDIFRFIFSNSKSSFTFENQSYLFGFCTCALRNWYIMVLIFLCFNICCKYMVLLNMIMKRTGSRPSSNDSITPVTWLELLNIFFIKDSSTCFSFCRSLSVTLYHTSLHDNIEDIKYAFLMTTAISKWNLPPGTLFRMLSIVFTIPDPFPTLQCSAVQCSAVLDLQFPKQLLDWKLLWGHQVIFKKKICLLLRHHVKSW